jgi:SAM-dependent methyltransferase
VGIRRRALEGLALMPGTVPARACRSCGAATDTVVADLGLQPPSNAYLLSAADAAGEARYPLRAVVCGTCKLVQLDYDVPPAELFKGYAYFSSFSDSWLDHARRYCEMAIQRFGLTQTSLVIELASNDGYLLKNFLSAGIPVLGIDPSDTVAAAAVKAGVPTLVEFFGLPVAERLAKGGSQADLIIANNVLAHVPALNDFVAGIATALKPHGVATLEFPHLLRLIENVEFDTIYHEHYSYFSLHAAERAFARAGLRLYDVEELPTHGGSLRIHVCHDANDARPDTAAVKRLRAEEAALEQLSTYSGFAARVEACGAALRTFLADARRDGKRVLAYGAAAKGNTLLNFVGATADDIAMVADRSPHKQGKLLPGTHIPIVSPERMLSERPDYILILPWNIRSEIMRQLEDARSWGAQFVTAVPTIQVHP